MLLGRARGSEPGWHGLQVVHESPELSAKCFVCAPLGFFVVVVGEMFHGFRYMHKGFVLLQKDQEPMLLVTKCHGNGF